MIDDRAPRPVADGSRGAPVSVGSVSVSYRQANGATLDAVDSVSIDISAGSIVALLGPSGCGKTSLLRAIAGLERPSRGRVCVGDQVVSDAANGTWVHPERRGVGMVFQDGALFPHLTVAQNIAFGLGGGRSTVARDARSTRVAEMLALVDLADFGDRLPGTLSGGQQQRVSLARSLAPEPSVLLLDEPFSALDAGLRMQVRADVARIVRAVGVTTIFVTHDQDEAFVLGDEVAVLRDGRIEQVGAPDVLYRQPANRWVAGFVGEANIVAGTASAVANTAVTSLGDVPLRERPVAVTPDVDVLIRPENLTIARAGADVPTGTVTNVEYYGHDVRYEVELGDGTVVAVRTQSPELFHHGEQVTVRFHGRATEAWPTTDR